LENLVAGEDLALTELAAAFADANAGEAITVNLTEAELADGDEGRASNYTLLSTDWPTTTATIDPRAVTLDGEFSAEDKVYDGSAEATLADTGGLSLNNLVEGEALNLESLAAAFEQSDVGENLAVSLTGEGLADGEGGSADNYTLSLDGAPATTASIDPRELTLGGEFSVEDREYDGTTEAAFDDTEGLILENLVNGEDLALTDLAAAFADANAGEAITVNLTEAGIADGVKGAADNYTLSLDGAPTTTATIDPRTVTLGGEFTARNKVYDGTTEAIFDETDGLSLENLVDGEDLELTDLAAAFAEAGPGEDIEVSLTNAELEDGQNGEASNYALSPDGWPVTHASIEPEPEPEPEPEQEGVSAGDTGDVLRRADDSADGDTALENERRTDPVAPDMAVGPISGSATLTALMQSEILVDERDLSGPVELVDDDDSEEGQ
ncbi:YDG domain-containing protein, partial [Thioalkalivibrio sp. AKL17]|uniref:YDG domain-containing protein n=1 Tax=Thioalkalivibrio sp. AKL17 TaxID=1158160 RepID=UPI00056F8612